MTMAPPAERNIKKIFIKSFIGIFAASCLLVALTFLVLKQGIHFNDLTIGKVSVSKCALIWNDKLELQIDTITISKEGKPKQATSDISFVKKTIDASQSFARFFSKLIINNLIIGEQSIAINLNQENDTSYALGLMTEYTDFQSRLTFEQDALVIDIVEAANQKYNSRVTGRVRLDAKDDNARGTITAFVNESFPVSIDIVADNEQLSFEGK
jgi:hypothetical protein